MEKPSSLIGLKSILKNLEKDYRDFEKTNVSAKVREYQTELYKQNEVFLKDYRDKISEVRNSIAAKELELSAKAKIPKEYQAYLRGPWSSGIAWGYGGVTLRYIDPKNRYWIATSNGGTGGQGTAMGTGGYHYCVCQHFVTFPQYGGFHDSSFGSKRLPDGISGFNSRFQIEGGRLTNEMRDALIEQADNFCDKYKVPSFKIEDRKVVVLK